MAALAAVSARIRRMRCILDFRLLSTARRRIDSKSISAVLSFAAQRRSSSIVRELSNSVHVSAE